VDAAPWAWAAIGLSVLGALDALYFLLVTYRVVRPDTRWVPSFCRMDEATCARIVDTSYGRALGVPNALPGLAWYVATGAWGAASLASGQALLCTPFLLAGAGVVAFSAYLAWALLTRLKVVCPLCFLAHGLNAALLGVILAACLA
jgi:uncharacterized membrane protein